MRAVAALLLLAAFWLALAACGGGAEPAPTAAEPQTQPQQNEEQPAPPDQSEEEADQPNQPEPAAQQVAGSQQTQPPDEPEPQAAPADPPPEIAEFVEALGGRAFEQPIELLAWPGGGLLVAEQRGGVSLYLDDGSVRGVLDLSERVIFRGEQGLLSVALDPEFADHPFLYVWYSPRGTNIARLSRFPVEGTLADAGRELTILEVPQPFPNHNGGAVRFGPDGMLYLGIGDGGAANDPYGHGQNAQTLLGAIIRIDVRDASTQYPYRVPADNPLLGVAGVRPEIYAWGMRNPWRMAFDPETGALWYADVGQNRVEEVGIIAPGGNHGWNVFEGTECFGRDEDCAALDHIPPLAEYGHDLGCSVTGGVVYRGAELPWLDGAYLFADYCSGRVWALEQFDGAWQMRELAQLDALISSFGVDAAGEVYLLTFDGPILRLSAAAAGG